MTPWPDEIDAAWRAVQAFSRSIGKDAVLEGDPGHLHRMRAWQGSDTVLEFDEKTNEWTVTAQDELVVEGFETDVDGLALFSREVGYELMEKAMFKTKSF